MVLTKLGQNCAHEGHMSYNKYETAWDDGPNVWGDASWMVVPYIESLPSGTVVLHQLRDPLKVLNSNLPPGGDSYFRTWNEHAGLESDPLYEKPIPWKRFIWEKTSDWVWPDGVAEGPESPEEIERLIHWWTNWNLWIECAASQRADLTYVRYRLEDLDWELLQNIGRLLTDIKVGPRRQHCESILKDVSTTTNRHRAPNDRITIDMLPPTARLLMHRYGYYDKIQESAL